MKGWAVEIGAVGSALDEFTRLSNLNFVKRLNALGFWSATLTTLDGADEPEAQDVARILWNKDEANERVFFEGVVSDVRRSDQSSYRTIKGLSLEGLLWQAKTGDVRTFKNRTPFSIIQGGGSPDDLLTNMQGNNVMGYGTASLPNVIDATNPGVAMDFRADPGPLLVNIQRLCLQSQFNNTHGASATEPLRYGLEFQARLEGANNSTPKFYLQRRREQSPAPGEAFTYGPDLLKMRRGIETLTAGQAVKVIGSGAGQAQVTSSVFGSGGLEGVVTDKTLVGLDNAAGNTNADVMERRLNELMDPSTEVVTGTSPKHIWDSDVGDSVTVKEEGQTDTALRLFSMAYRLHPQGMLQGLFNLAWGRPRVLRDDAWLKLDSAFGGHAQGPQIMAGTAANASQPITNGAGQSRADGETTTPTTLNFSNQLFDRDLHEALSLYYQVSSTAAGPIDIILRVPSGGTFVTRNAQDVKADTVYEGMVYLPEGFLRSVTGTGIASSASIEVENRTGSTATIIQQLSGWVQA